MQECRAGYPQADAPLVESNIELMRSRVGREKGLVPACFMLGAPEYSCDYAEASNETHCETAKHGVFPAQTFTVVWHDQDCGSYSGEVFLESSGAASRRKLVARLTPIEPGRLQAEGVDTDFDWGIPWPAPPGGSSALQLLDTGLCLVNLRSSPDADGITSQVSLCADYN